MKSIGIVHSLDPNPDRAQQTGAPPGEYNLYLDSNGRWTFIGGRPPLDPDTSPQLAPGLGSVTDGETVPVNAGVDFFVPVGAPVRVAVSGRECDLPRMEPCLANAEVSDGNDHPGQAIDTFPSADAALGDHRMTSPLGHWFMDYSVARESSGGPSPPGSSGVSTSQPGSNLGGRGAVASAAGGGVVAGCLDRVAPASHLAGKLLLRRLRGTAADRACGRRGRLARVTVAVARRVQGGCRYLRASGRFGMRTSCRRPTYVNARGTKRWSLGVHHRLARGTYVVRSRAIDAAGNVERKRRLRGRARNFATLTR
jgi:hypothetical protein